MTDKLKERIDAKVREIHAVADDLPGVVIIHNIVNFHVEYMSPRGLRELGATMEELKAMGADYHNHYFNPEESAQYVPQIMDLILRRDEGGIVTNFQQVRFTPNGPWSWYLSTTKLLLKDDDGSPVLTITMASPIDPVHHLTSKVARLLDENNFLRKNYENFNKLSGREKEVLKCLAQGKSNVGISEALSISVATVETHRKNIRRKIDISSNYDLSMYARAFDLI